MPVLDIAQERAETVRGDVFTAVAALQSELHAKARAETDPIVARRWVHMSLNITVAIGKISSAVTAATDALMTGEPAVPEWE